MFFKLLKSLKKFGLAIYAKDIKNIIEIINTIAPEHLEVNTKNNNEIVIDETDKKIASLRGDLNKIQEMYNSIETYDFLDLIKKE